MERRERDKVKQNPDNDGENMIRVEGIRGNCGTRRRWQLYSTIVGRLWREGFEQQSRVIRHVDFPEEGVVLVVAKC